MVGVAIHSLTKRQFRQCVSSPPHALLLTGPAGLGKHFLARQLAAQILDVPEAKLANHGYVLEVLPDKQTIGIDAVRQAITFLQKKTIGEGTIRRVVTVIDAHFMTTEAQNAFLKALEEPPADTIIIMTATKAQLLLSTITSRTQHMTVHIPPFAELQQLFGSRTGFERAYRMSGGLPGLLHALLSEDAGHPLYQAVEQAKTLLGQTAFERLATFDSMTRDRVQAASLLEAIERIAQAGLEQSASKQQTIAVRRWQRLLQAAYAAREALDKNANLKLVFSDFCLKA